MAAKPRIPAYCLHKPSGRAIVKVAGKLIYLGKHGSDESREAYARIIADIMAGRPVRKPQPAENGCTITTKSALTVGRLAARFLAHAEGYYLKNGEPTSEVHLVRRSMEFLAQSHGSLPASEFSIGDLKVVRQAIVDAGPSRGVVNKYVGRIKRAFTWGATEELIPATVPQSLGLLPGLKAGRTKARETKPVLPVPTDVVETTIQHTPPVVGDMVRLHLLTGMRPDEVCSIRPVDIDRTGEVWEYTPESHKTQHHGKRRVVYIGPEGQAILTPYLLREEAHYCFQPKRHVAVPLAKKRYRVDSYRHAIQRACDKAGVERWSPNQIRHTTATEIRKQFGLEASQIALGHSKADVTQIYAERDTAKGIEVARQIGSDYIYPPGCGFITRTDRRLVALHLTRLPSVGLALTKGAFSWKTIPKRPTLPKNSAFSQSSFVSAIGRRPILSRWSTTPANR